MRTLIHSDGTTMSPESFPENSTWQSPVPYLFGGLAAMLGFIAFALLILACSYWRFKGSLVQEESSSSAAAAAVESKEAGPTRKPTPYLEMGFVVLMPGDHKPTFLATPSTSRCGSFGETGGQVTGKAEEKVKEGDGNQQN